MVNLVVLFWMFVILFSVIGAMRGWARELLVSFSVILALFILTVMETYIPFIRDELRNDPVALFWLRTGVLLMMVFFGYQTPNIPRLSAQNRFARDRLQDILLGIFMGALNGWLIAGSLWYYMHVAGYPWPDLVSAPVGEVANVTSRMMTMMPPELLGGSSAIYFAVALAFAFVIVVFI